MLKAILITSSALLILLILHDAFEVMLLPRRVKSRIRLVRYFFRITWSFWSRIARGITFTDSRHNFLSWYGPLSMVLLLCVWAVGLIAGFGTLYWALDFGRAMRTSWPDQLYFSGSSFFTLGYGDLLPRTDVAKALAVAEAGTGLGFLATVIGYMPVLYQLFARREAKVIMLDAAAGSPPCATTLLLRHAEGDGLKELDQLLFEWQQWSAELLESQLSYPMLAFYRSQHDNQSWLAALTAIMDCCALLMTGFKGVRTFRARQTYSTARQAVIEMGRVFKLGARPLEEDRLPPEDFKRMCANLVDAGLLCGDSEDSEQKLAAFRKTYEPFLNGLAYYLVLPLPPWLPGENQMDNWQSGPRGKSAKQLIDTVPAKPE
jgi:Ion channel